MLGNPKNVREAFEIWREAYHYLGTHQGPTPAEVREAAYKAIDLAIEPFMPDEHERRRCVEDLIRHARERSPWHWIQLRIAERSAA